jgi:hypothetical protein
VLESETYHICHLTFGEMNLWSLWIVLPLVVVELQCIILFSYGYGIWTMIFVVYVLVFVLQFYGFMAISLFWMLYNI